MLTPCRVIVPVFNSPHLVRDCLNSIHAQLSESVRVTVVDDGSAPFVHSWVKSFCEQHGFDFISHDNRGFAASVNRAIKRSTEPWTLVLNSDTELPPNAVSRLVAVGESAADIGMVNPLTNHAAQIDLPRPPGWSFLDVDRWLERERLAAVDVVTAVGFCLLIRRAAIDELGLFDEAFGRGYCEDSDLAMRFLSCGWRNVVAQNVYVHHQGQGSFTDRGKRYRSNRALFDERWAADYRSRFRAFLRNAPLASVRARLNPTMRRETKAVVWTAGRAVRERKANQEWLQLGVELLRGVKRLLTHRVVSFSPALEAERPDAGAPSVIYLLESMVIAGGVMSVIQVVNGLIRQGVDARIATLFKDPLVDGWMGCLTEPMVFATEQELVAKLPSCDVAVATLWSTMPWTRRLLAEGRVQRIAAFVQDYEPWFVAADKRAAIASDYASMDSCIVKSRWLDARLREHGANTQRIGLGLDRLRYFPVYPKETPAVVLAMARPGTRWRGFWHLAKAFRLLCQRRPDVRILFFGSPSLPSERELGFAFENAGVVHSPMQLSKLYSRASVFIDGSDFQGFGRCGLEAMACGTPCVLTREGGVSEYALDEENCILVEPEQPDSWVAALERVLDDAALRERLMEGGFSTVDAWSLERETHETKRFLQRLVSEGS